MSLKNLVEGDCGGQNALVQFSSHFTQDQGYQQQGIHGGPGQYSQSNLFVQEFLDQNLAPRTQTFHMDTLLNEMKEIELANARSQINQAPNVSALVPGESSSIWSEQFLNSEKHYLAAEQRYVNTGGEFSSHHPLVKQDENMFNLDFDKFQYQGSEEEWVQNFLKSPDNTQQASSKFFKFMNPSTATATGTEAITEDKRLEDEEFSKWTKEFLKENPVNEDGVEFGRMNEIFNRVSSTEQDAAATDSKLFENAWNNDPDTIDFSNQFWNQFQEKWEKISGEISDEDAEKSDLPRYVADSKNYNFADDNPMKNVEKPFEEGLRKLKEGDLPSAVLCFEAAAEAEPDNVLAWQYLGTTQAENEQDDQAILALANCLRLEPQNLTALISMAISCTNENYQRNACHALKDWLRFNQKYSDLITDGGEASGGGEEAGFPKVTSFVSQDLHEHVRDLYIKAANKYPTGGIDVDVQCGLGVLFNLSREYDKAADCFKTALQVKPDDFRMWNKLGATLANGNRSEEAVDAYHHALELSPGYIRARYNLGITCCNLQAYREAVEHMLVALNQQANGRNSLGNVGTMSESIWSTMRLALSMMKRTDLLPAAIDRDLTKLNTEFNFKL